MLAGKKTYTAVIISIIYAISGYLSGHLDLNTAIQFILPMLGIAGVRAGIANGGAS